MICRMQYIYCILLRSFELFHSVRYFNSAYLRYGGRSTGSPQACKITIVPMGFESVVMKTLVNMVHLLYIYSK
jgi:hypothetical protein